MAKSPDAFRTISEVADWLGIQAHVLRFWESKFTQVKPIKRAGGRRYYRPADMLLLGGIKQLLHEDGLTIKGVQKILREEGMTHVADMSEPLDELTMSQFNEAKPKVTEKPATAVVVPEEEKGIVLNFEASSAAKSDKDEAQDADTKEEVTTEVSEPTSATDAPSAPPAEEPVTVEPAVEGAAEPKTPAIEPDPEATPEIVIEVEAPVSQVEAQEPTTPPEVEVPESVKVEPEAQLQEPEAEAKGTPPEAEQTVTEEDIAPEEDQQQPEAEQPAPAAALPAFLRRPLADQDTAAPKPTIPDAPDTQDEAVSQAASEPETTPEIEDVTEVEEQPEPPAPKPRIVDLPAFTAEADFPAAPAALSAAFRARKIKPGQTDQARTLLKQLTALRDSMSARRRGATPPPAKD